MSKEQVFSIVSVIIFEYMGTVPLEDITLESAVHEDLGMDSLEVISVIYEIEEKFDIRIDDVQIAEFNTVGDIVEVVMRYLENKE